MGLFSANFDASGNAVDQPFVVVGGYIANYLQWKQFGQSWEWVHKQFGVNLPFHMADFAAALTNPKYKTQKNARQDYVAIAADEKKAQEFLLQLTITEAAVVNCSVTALIPMNVYNGVSSLLDLRKVVPPYALAARMCLEMVKQWEQMMHVHTPVECIFEEGDFEQGKFTDLMIDEGMAPPIYKKKADFAGLQGADHYAWERAYFAKQLDSSSPIITRAHYDMLLSLIPTLHVQATQDNLIRVCHMKGINPKTGVKK
jgi:hypothetical protein